MVHATGAGQAFRVNGVNGVGASSLRLKVKGKGILYLRQDDPDGKLLGKVAFESYFKEWQFVQ